MFENLKEILSDIFASLEKMSESQIKYEDTDDNEIVLTKKKYLRNLNRLTYISLEINQDSNNSCLLFSTGDEIVYDIAVDPVFKINKQFNFEPNKTYIVAVDNFTIIWSALENYEE